ncbi:lectin-like [Chiloscyllium punctatum]|uniref:lectin-like n=1 Tax=Chiloscyllium punctatum TaxID=137246 RepID=UPI003B632010
MMLLMGLVLSTLMVRDVAADELTMQNSTPLDQNLQQCSPLAKGYCSDGFIYFGYCYKFVPKKMTWIDAELHCQHLAPGGHLASLHGMEQNKVLANMIHNSKNKCSPIWIGLNDVHKEGTFQWSDGSALDFIFWMKGEPSDSGGREDCVQILFRKSVQWNDSHCYLRFCSLCSYKLPPPCCE